MSENPNIAPVNCMELTVREFHERRRHLADCLYILLQATERAETTEDPLLKRVEGYVRSDLIPGVREQGREVPLASQIFHEIEQLSSALTKADAARKNARSNTVAPSAQGKLVFSFRKVSH